jgi:hypothetical protein
MSLRRFIIPLAAPVSAILLLAFAVRWAVDLTGTGDVRPGDLARLIDRADRLVVLRDPWGEDVLFQSAERSDLDALKAALRVERPDQYLHCKCDGTPAIYLYSGAEKIGQITNHHAKLIRCNLWASDAVLQDREALLAWFDERGIAGPREEVERARQRDEEWDGAWRKWVEAMPAPLKTHWSFEGIGGPGPGSDLSPLRQALAEQIPDSKERIRALFGWYGSGTGSWSGFPAYEDVAEKLLLDYPTVDLIAALEGKDLTLAQLEGAARLFAGWTFSQKRPNDRRLLPAGWKQRLLQHSLATATRDTWEDKDKRGRAQSAFGQ